MRKRQKKNKKSFSPFFFGCLIGFILGFLLDLLNVKNIPFLIFSININILFIYIIKFTMTKLNIEFSKKEKRYILIS